MHIDDSAAATSCLMALCISSCRSKLVLINCFNSNISDFMSLSSSLTSDIDALDGTSGSNDLKLCRPTLFIHFQYRDIIPSSGGTISAAALKGAVNVLSCNSIPDLVSSILQYIVISTRHI